MDSCAPMKFGAFLEANKFPRWASRHVEYGYLRRLTDDVKSKESRGTSGNVLEVTTAGAVEPVRAFITALEDELVKVEQFVRTKLDELSGRASLLTRNLARAKELVSRSGAEDESERFRPALLELRVEAGKVLTTTVRLDGYIRLNAVALDKAAKKFDKVAGQSTRAWVRAKLSAPSSFLHADLDSLLVPMSNIFHRLRVLLGDKDDAEPAAAAAAAAASAASAASAATVTPAEAKGGEDGAEGAAGGKDGKPAVWQPPSSFSRDTRKYWVAPGDVTIVKALLVRHLPVLVFGVDTTSESVISPADRHKAMATRDSGLITSVYLDSEDLSSYTSRLRKEEGARLLRVRWYGDMDFPKTEQPCFMEQKTHHESWVDAKSVKERFTLRGRMIGGFLKGSLDAVRAHQRSLHAAGALSEADMEEQTHLAEEICSFVGEKALRPLVRTRYRRTAFQRPDTNRVRVSLDTDMGVFLDGEAGDGSWARRTYSGSRIPPQHAEQAGEHGDRFLFPMAVMEIKLSGVDVEPEWLQTLKTSGLLHECGKFSKFASGVALLQPKAVPFLPHWFEPDGTMAGIPASTGAAVAMGLPSYMGVLSSADKDAAEAAAAASGFAADGSSPEADAPPSATARRAQVHGQMDWTGFGSDSDSDGAAAPFLPGSPKRPGGPGRRVTNVASLDQLFRDGAAAASPEAAEAAGHTPLVAPVPAALRAPANGTAIRTGDVGLVVTVGGTDAPAPAPAPADGPRRRMQPLEVEHPAAAGAPARSARGGATSAGRPAPLALAADRDSPAGGRTAPASAGCCDCGGNSGWAAFPETAAARGAQCCPCVCMPCCCPVGCRAAGNRCGAGCAYAFDGILPECCCRPCGCAAGVEDGNSRRLVPVKVEPKSILALERTLIQWISASLFLVSFAAVLIPLGGGALVIGYILTPTAIVFLVYALWIYLARSRAMRERRGDFQYELKTGPCVLVSVLIVVLILSFVDSFVPFLGVGVGGQGSTTTNNNNVVVAVGGAAPAAIPSSPSLTAAADCWRLAPDLSALTAPAQPKPLSLRAAAADVGAGVLLAADPVSTAVAALPAFGSDVTAWASAGTGSVSPTSLAAVPASAPTAGRARFLASLAAPATVAGMVASTANGTSATSFSVAAALTAAGLPATSVVRGVAALDSGAAATACGATLVSLLVATDDSLVSVDVPGVTVWQSDCPVLLGPAAPVPTAALSLTRDVMTHADVRAAIAASLPTGTPVDTTQWRVASLGSRPGAAGALLTLASSSSATGNVVVELSSPGLDVVSAASVGGSSTLVEGASAAGADTTLLAFAGRPSQAWVVRRAAGAAWPACSL